MSDFTTKLGGKRNRSIGREGFPQVQETITVEKWSGGLDLVFEDKDGGRVSRRFTNESARLLYIHIGANLPVPGRTD